MSHPAKRILWIDVAKGICMLSVMAGHLGSKPINNVVFAYHLTVFFLLSGLTLKPDLSVESVAKRFRALMTPYFITCACICAMDVVNLVVLDGQTDMKVITATLAQDLLRSFMASGTRTNFGSIQIGSMIGALWFLPAMFFATITAQLLLRNVAGRKERYIVAVSASVLSHISAQFLWLPFSIQAGVFVAPFLLIGYDLRNSDVLEKFRLPQFFLCLGVFLAGITGELTKIYFVTTTVSDLLLSTVVALAASGCVCFLSKKLEKSRVLGSIGKNSIYFLCIHAFDIAVMGRWFKGGLALLGIGYPPVVRYFVRLAFASALTALLLWRKKRDRAPALPSHRDPGLDMAKGALIVLMLVGHFTIHERLRDIIYSFHMVAFVFYSGYCYRPGASKVLGKSLLKLAKAFLIPYAVFGIFYIWLMHYGLKQELANLLLGMSFSKRGFSGIDSIGPVYFILLLFVTRSVYLLLERWVSDEKWRAWGVLVLSLTGVALGRLGLWLPWSVDVALYCLIFYYLGILCKQHGIMEHLLRRPWYYFVMSCVWVYMIYKGSMEVATRSYGNYGLVILGAVCGSILTYQLFRYLSTALPRLVTRLLCLIGENTLYILIVHRLLNSRFNKLYSPHLTPGYLWHTIAMIASQVLLGVLIGVAVAWVKKKRSKSVKSS